MPSSSEVRDGMESEKPLTHVRAPFAGETRTFRLTIGGARAIEEACRAGIGAVFSRLVTNQFYADDVLAVIRHGLAGGGLREPRASALVIREIGDAEGELRAPLADYVDLATSIVRSFLAGIPPGKPAAEESDPGPATSPPSTAPAAPPGSPPASATI